MRVCAMDMFVDLPKQNGICLLLCEEIKEQNKLIGKGQELTSWTSF